MCTTKYKN